MRWASFVGLGLLLGAAGCEDSPAGGAVQHRSGALGEANVDLTSTRQAISGFGVSSAWYATNISDTMANQLFSADQGVGLSLLRVHIQPDGNTSERATAQKAVARGARVWAAPWSPPGEWKDNGSDRNGGSLLTARYQDWANRLAAFAKSMSDAGVPLLMLSAQNEPNWTADWETCRWTATQLVTFIRANLGPALQAQGVSTRVLAPETIDWTSLASYANPILSDATARGFIGAIATHGYGGTAFDYTAAAQNGKELWVTELDDGLDGAYDATMNGGLRVAKLIHDHLTIANANAWHYWWIMGGTPGNAALTDGTTLNRRAYVMGNWSKFVRPGFVRVDATPAPQTNVLVTAFRDPTTGRVVIVAANQGSGSVAQTFILTGTSPAQMRPWVTSDSAALVQQSATVGVANGTFTYTLPARSVTTFVGDLSTGGTGGAGGATGGAGGAGTGGSGGTAGFACAASPPPSALITDFSVWNAASGQWGGPTTLTGGIFAYNNSGGSLAASVDTSAQALRGSGAVQGWGGVGLWFGPCVDASAYGGVEFTIAGSLGGCALALQVQTNSDHTIDSAGMRGTCTSGCAFPARTGLPTSGVVTVPFSQLTGGSPSPFDPRELRGLQWQLTGTSCSASFTIDDVRFVNVAGGTGGAGAAGGTGGAAGGPDGGPGTDGETGGCACRIDGGGGAALSWTGLLLAGALGAAFRRRRR